MKIENYFFLIVIFFFAGISCLSAQAVKIQKKDIVFSAIKGHPGKPDTFSLPSQTGIRDIRWVSGDSADFKIQSLKTATGKNRRWVLVFEPSPDFIGITRAMLQVYNSAAKTVAEISLTGLSTKGLEGENEAPLSSVIDALGYRINIGWTALANHSRPELQGDELPFSLFHKAGKGKVEMLPVARYSPDFELPFGYYLNTANGPAKQQAGVLAKAGKYPEHQTLFPAIASGGRSFDPGNESFGFYATGPSHSAYSEDVWNMLLHPENAVRAVRIYPVKNLEGSLLKNTYLVCFEEAKNGDYNDYVFLVKNITPVTTNSFTDIFNGKNFNGWHTFIKDKGKILILIIISGLKTAHCMLLEKNWDTQ